MKNIASTRPTVRKKMRLQAALGLGLASDALDVRRTGEAVTDTGTDGATGEGDATADEGAGQLDGVELLLRLPCLSLVTHR